MKHHLILLSALGAATLASGCDRATEASNLSSGGAGAATVEVATAEARRTSEAGELEVPGTIQSRRRAVLTSRLAASIVELNPREGDDVGVGAVLVRLEDASLRASLTATEVADMSADRDLTRARALFARGAATRSEVESAETAAERTRAARVAARESLSHATIRAPFAARVLRKVANAGDIVAPGQPLLEIEGAGGLEIVASVPGSIRDRLRAGQVVDVRVDGLAASLSATIHDLEASADPATHRFTVRADIATGEGVRAGAFARILMPPSEGEARILVPSDALFQRGGLSGVFVIRDGRAFLRWIAPGVVTEHDVEARAGLDAGERVALDPTRLLDGAHVREMRR